jgi:FAD/FMN-containing dehydrogenase
MTLHADLEEITGPDQVVSDPEILSNYSTDTSFSKGTPPVHIVRPLTYEHVQSLVKLANEQGIPLVPVSSEAPRGRGDTLPTVANSVIVDLSGMKSIVRVDRRNQAAIVQPGVTFGELIEAASVENLRVAMPLMPRLTKSVVGSMLEREPTTMPKYHWDMQDPLCCIEVVFGTGDLFRTGSAAGPGTLEQQWASGQAQKSPMGPSQADWAKIIQGSQGTMGIVTWASVKLEQKPQIEKGFLVGGNKLNKLIDFTYAVTKARLADHCFILNRTDLKAAFEVAGEDIPQWIVFYTIAGYRRFPEERVAYLEADINDIASGLGVQPKTRIADIHASNLLKRIGSTSPDPHWKAKPESAFQDIFFLTTLDKAHIFADKMAELADQHGIPGKNIGVYIQPLQQGRCCHLEFTLMYASDDTEKIKTMFDAAAKAMSDMGGFFSRPYGSWAGLTYARCPDSVSALKKVKKILDPNGVMNPGKLCFN